jgi:hypothetical protein
MQQAALDRLRAEFLEMPGLRLTAAQVHRFCGVEDVACLSALEALVKENFLCAKPDGTYARSTDGRAPRRVSAKASLPAASAKRLAS